MSRDSIDKAIYDKKRYDELREQGVSEDRAKRVATVPSDNKKKPKETSIRKTTIQNEFGKSKQIESIQDGPEDDGQPIRTTSPRTGI